MDTDSTPVFYVSKRLFVSGRKISSGSSVYPTAAVTKVEVLRKSAAYMFEVLKVLGIGVLTLSLGVPIARFVASYFGALESSSESEWLYPGLVLILGLLTLVAGAYGLARYAMEKTLHVRFSSGDSLTIRSFDKNAVREMHAAVERAMMYSATAASGIPSVADELGRLSQLKLRGAISEDDWERAKDLFLGKRPDAQERAITQLQQLYELRKSGVLSESEYNLKKWDILSRSV